MSTPQTRKVLETVARIKPHLAGLAPEVQGAVLCELLSLWLAGHRVEGDPEATVALRKALIDNHIESALDMLPANQAAIDVGVALKRARAAARQGPP